MKKKRSRRPRIALITTYLSGYYLGEIVYNIRELSIINDFDLIAIQTRSIAKYDIPIGLNKFDGVIILINSISPVLAKEIIRLEIPTISIGYAYFPLKVE